MSSNQSILSFTHLSFERNEKLLFEKLQGVIRSGEMMQVEGPNGSGKSTFLRLLSGLLSPTEGEITWAGCSIFKNKSFYQQQLQYLTHQNTLKSSLTVDENIQLMSVLSSGQRASVSVRQAVTKQLGLGASLTVTNLSAGQLRRLSLAKLLLASKPVWILDEPISNLDQEGQSFFSHLVERHLTHQGIVVLATHQSLPLISPVKTIKLGEMTCSAI